MMTSPPSASKSAMGFSRRVSREPGQWSRGSGVGAVESGQLLGRIPGSMPATANGQSATSPRTCEVSLLAPRAVRFHCVCVRAHAQPIDCEARRVHSLSRCALSPV